MERCWQTAVMLLLPLFPTAVASAIDIAPHHIPAGKEATVKISSRFGNFDPTSRSTYKLSVQWSDRLLPAASAESPCAVESTSLLQCSVAWSSPGVVNAMAQVNGTLFYTTVLNIYAKPVVTSIVPVSLPLLGGSKLRVNFAEAVTNFDSIVIRYVDTNTTAYTDNPLDMKAIDNGMSASGRSSSVPGFSNNTAARVLLSLNGYSFDDTGIIVNFHEITKLKIGFIYAEDPSDFGWYFQHNVARLKLEETFFGLVETFYEGHVVEWGPNECDFCAEEPGWNSSKMLGKWNDEPADYFGTHRSAMVIKKWIEEEGVKMIITTSFYYQWDAYHMAKRYPDIPMIHAAGWMTRDNMAVVFPKVYQARYLSGIVMAWYIKKNKLPKRVGYVSAFPVGETVRHINAFKLGMEKVDPEIEIYLIWLKTWLDPRKERLGTSRLAKFYGVEGVAQHTDSREPQIVMNELGKVGIGYNTDMLLTVGDSVLTSPVLVWSTLYAPLVQKVLDGESLGGADIFAGLESDAWRLSDFSSRVPTEAALLVEEEQEKLRHGIDDIFCKPGMKDNKGRVRNGPVDVTVNRPFGSHIIPGTTCLTRSEVTQSCQVYEGFDCVEQWLLEGVHDSCAPSPSKPQGITSPELSNGECFLGWMDIPDECPHGTYLTLMGCTKVPAGSFSRSEKVIPCPSGFAAPIEGATACTPCSPGYAADQEGSIKCSPCPMGSYSSKTACTTCNPGQFASHGGMSKCEYCAVGRYAGAHGATHCESCSADMRTFTNVTINGKQQWTYLEGATTPEECACEKGMRPDTKGACINCTVGMACPGMGQVTIEPGYYSDASVSVYECRDQMLCPGGQPGNTCAPDRIGIVCSSCKAGMIPGSEGACRSCTFWDKAILICAAPAWLLLSGGLHLFWHHGAATTEAFETVIAAATVGFAVQILQMFKVFSGLEVEWPGVVNTLLNLASVLLLDVNMLGPECTFERLHPAVRYCMSQVLPVMFVIALCAWLLISELSSKFCWKALSQFNRVTVASTVGLVWQALVVTIASSAFWVFTCVRHPNGLDTLIEYAEIQCWIDPSHHTMIVIGVMSALLNICVPAAFVIWILVVAPQRVTDPDFRVATRFLFFKFLPDRFWFALVLIIRSLAFAMIGPVVRNNAFSQIATMLGLLIFSLCVHIMWLPYSEYFCNNFETAELAGLALLLTMGMYFIPTTPESNEDFAHTLQSMMIAIFISCAFALLLVFACCLYAACFPGYLQKQREARSVDLFKHIRVACMMLAGMDDSAGQTFIAHTSYMDTYHLTKMVDLVMLELCGLRSAASRQLPRLPVQVIEGVEITHVTSESLQRSRDLGLQRLANIATATSRYLSDTSELTLAQASGELDGAASSALILASHTTLNATGSRSTPILSRGTNSGRELVAANITLTSQTRPPESSTNANNEANDCFMSI